MEQVGIDERLEDEDDLEVAQVVQKGERLDDLNYHVLFCLLLGHPYVDAESHEYEQTASHTLLGEVLVLLNED